jgi:hypothetical protein
MTSWANGIVYRRLKGGGRGRGGVEGDGGTVFVGYGVPPGEDEVWRGCMCGAERKDTAKKKAGAGKQNLPFSYRGFSIAATSPSLNRIIFRTLTYFETIPTHRPLPYQHSPRSISPTPPPKCPPVSFPPHPAQTPILHFTHMHTTQPTTFPLFSHR